VLVVLAATVAVPFGLAPSALAAETGQITGEVTNVSTHAPISGIQVCTNVIGECDATDGAGKYVIPDVAPGTYTLQFYSRDSLTLNYISRELPGVVVAAGVSLWQPGKHVKSTWRCSPAGGSRDT
jgi:hypothetical protein